MKIYLPDNNILMNIDNIEKVNLPIIATLEETGIDLTAAVGCIVWINSTTGEVTATTYTGGEMIPVQVDASNAEKEALNRFADSFYN